MVEENRAEIERLGNVRWGEMEEVLKQACDPWDSRDAEKEWLDAELLDLRCTMADNDATLICNISRLHDQIHGKPFPWSLLSSGSPSRVLCFSLEVFIFRLVEPGLVLFC